MVYNIAYKYLVDKYGITQSISLNRKGLTEFKKARNKKERIAVEQCPSNYDHILNRHLIQGTDDIGIYLLIQQYRLGQAAKDELKLKMENMGLI